MFPFLLPNSYYLNVITVTKLAVFQHDITKCENNLLHRWRPDGPWTVQIIPVVHRIAFTLYHTISRHQLVPMAISYSFCIKMFYFLSVLWKIRIHMYTAWRGETWRHLFREKNKTIFLVEIEYHFSVQYSIAVRPLSNIWNFNLQWNDNLVSFFNPRLVKHNYFFYIQQHSFQNYWARSNRGQLFFFKFFLKY